MPDLELAASTRRSTIRSCSSPTSSGSPPSATNTYCAAHHKAYSAFAADLAGGTMPAYVFITPNLCNDMHGAIGCPSGSDITRGDTWLSNELPRIVTYAMAHDSIIYVIWDEGSSNQIIPFFAIGPHVKTGMTTTAYSHSASAEDGRGTARPADARDRVRRARLREHVRRRLLPLIATRGRCGAPRRSRAATSRSGPPTDLPSARRAASARSPS